MMLNGAATLRGVTDPSRTLANDHVALRGQSHPNAPLSAGQVVEGRLQCPYHGWEFGADGGCRFIPALGPDATLPPRAHIAAPLVREIHGLVVVCLEPGPTEPPLLAVPEWGAPGIVPVWLPVVETRGGAAQLL